MRAWFSAITLCQSPGTHFADFEQDAEQEIGLIGLLMIEPRHRHGTPQIGQVVNANALLPAVGRRTSPRHLSVDREHRSHHAAH